MKVRVQLVRGAGGEKKEEVLAQEQLGVAAAQTQLPFALQPHSFILSLLKLSILTGVLDASVYYLVHFVTLWSSSISISYLIMSTRHFATLAMKSKKERAKGTERRQTKKYIRWLFFFFFFFFFSFPPQSPSSSSHHHITLLHGSCMRWIDRPTINAEICQTVHES